MILSAPTIHGDRLRDAGLPSSTGTSGVCYGNSMMESFWGIMQIEPPDRKTRKSKKEIANAIFERIECWHNPKRRHSSPGMLSPAGDGTHLRRRPLVQAGAGPARWGRRHAGDRPAAGANPPQAAGRPAWPDLSPQPGSSTIMSMQTSPASVFET